TRNDVRAAWSSKCPLVREISLRHVRLFCGGRLAIKNLIAMGVAAKSLDDRPHMVSLRHQGLIDRPQVSGSTCNYLLAKSNENIGTSKVGRTFAVATRLTIDHPAPRCAQRCVVAV